VKKHREDKSDSKSVAPPKSKPLKTEGKEDKKDGKETEKKDRKSTVVVPTVKTDKKGAKDTKDDKTPSEVKNNKHILYKGRYITDS